MNLVRSITANKAAKIMGVSNKTLVTWRELRNFPMKGTKGTTNKSRILWKVDVSDMARWLWREKYWGDWHEREIRTVIREKLSL